MTYDITGEITSKLTEDELMDSFIKWIESRNETFTGGISPILETVETEEVEATEEVVESPEAAE